MYIVYLKQICNFPRSNVESTNLKNLTNLTNLTEKLKNLASRTFAKFDLEKFEPNVEVFLNDDDVLKGRVECPACFNWVGLGLKKGKGSNIDTWVNSNFLLHMNRVHANEYKRIIVK